MPTSESVYKIYETRTKRLVWTCLAANGADAIRQVVEVERGRPLKQGERAGKPPSESDYTAEDATLERARFLIDELGATFRELYDLLQSPAVADALCADRKFPPAHRTDDGGLRIFCALTGRGALLATISGEKPPRPETSG